MTARITALAIRDAAQRGDMEELTNLLARHQELLSSCTTDEIRDICAIFDEAEQLLRIQMNETQSELRSLSKTGRGVRQYKTAA